MSIKFLVLGGAVILGLGGGGSADFIFMGARIFLKMSLKSPSWKAGFSFTNSVGHSST